MNIKRASSKGRPSIRSRSRAGRAAWDSSGSPASTLSTWFTPSITGERPGLTSRAGGIAGRWSTRSTRCWVTRSRATAWGEGCLSDLPGTGEIVFRHAAAVIALGEPVKQVVVDEKGVPADRVSVIYPGIDLAEYETPGEPAAIPGVDSEHKVVMYVGSIVHPNQGVPILIEALPAGVRGSAGGALRAGRRSRRGRRRLSGPARPLTAIGSSC